MARGCPNRSGLKAEEGLSISSRLMRTRVLRLRTAALPDSVFHLYLPQVKSWRPRVNQRPGHECVETEAVTL